MASHKQISLVEHKTINCGHSKSARKNKIQKQNKKNKLVNIKNVSVNIFINL